MNDPIDVFELSGPVETDAGPQTPSTARFFNSSRRSDWLSAAGWLVAAVLAALAASTNLVTIRVMSRALGGTAADGRPSLFAVIRQDALGHYVLSQPNAEPPNDYHGQAPAFAVLLLIAATLCAFLGLGQLTSRPIWRRSRLPVSLLTTALLLSTTAGIVLDLVVLPDQFDIGGGASPTLAFGAGAWFAFGACAVGVAGAVLALRTDRALRADRTHQTDLATLGTDPDEARR